jgi:hypothetical protein
MSPLTLGCFMASQGDNCHCEGAGGGTCMLILGIFLLAMGLALADTSLASDIEFRAACFFGGPMSILLGLAMICTACCDRPYNPRNLNF